MIGLFEPRGIAGRMDARAAGPSARPTKVIAEGYSADPLPFGMDSPLELRGGADGAVPDVSARLGCEWNAGLLDLVAAACRRQTASGRHWFRMDPVVLTGPTGAGRTHLARRLAAEAGVPHIPIDVAGSAGATMLGSVGRGPTPSCPTMLGLATLASGCANPVFDVSGIADADPVTLGRLAAAIDPMRGRLDDEGFALVLDLSEATWLIQLPAEAGLPAQLRDLTAVVPLAEPVTPEWRELAWIETLVELAADRGVDLDAEPPDRLAAMLAAPHAPVDAAGRYRLAEELFDQAVGIA